MRISCIQCIDSSQIGDSSTHVFRVCEMPRLLGDSLILLRSECIDTCQNVAFLHMLHWSSKCIVTPGFILPHVSHSLNF